MTETAGSYCMYLGHKQELYGGSSTFIFQKWCLKNFKYFEHFWILSMQLIVVDLMKCVKFRTTTLLDQQVRATLDLLSACSVASCRQHVHILQLVKTTCLNYSRELFTVIANVQYTTFSTTQSWGSFNGHLKGHLDIWWHLSTMANKK